VLVEHENLLREELEEYEALVMQAGWKRFSSVMFGRTLSIDDRLKFSEASEEKRTALCGEFREAAYAFKYVPGRIAEIRAELDYIAGLPEEDDDLVVEEPASLWNNIDKDFN